MIPIRKPLGGYDDGKRPQINSWMTYMSRLPEQIELDNWWPTTDKEPFNIAVLTGPISNLAVLDLDDEESYQNVISVNKELEKTLTAKTGKGFHIYFRPSVTKRTRTFVMNGKTHHFKQTGGYVVAPPSRHMSGRQYEFITVMPPASFDVDSVEQSISKAGGLFSATEASIKERPATWASELFDVCPEGQRNTRGAQLCGLLIRKFAYDAGVVWGIMDAWNDKFCKPPISQSELKSLVEGEWRRYGPRE